MITIQEKLNISRKLLNKGLINFKESEVLKTKDFTDIYNVLCYVEEELDVDTSKLDLKWLLCN